MVKNGKPYSIENGRIDDALLTDLPIEDQERVIRWIKKNIAPRKTPNYSCSSYGIKHWLQNTIGIYLTNNQFKDAMWQCGYKPVNENKLNWNYRIKLIKHTEAEHDTWYSSI